MSVYAIIPARSGSKGVPDKNIRFLGGHPLLAWSIAAAKLCPSISRIVVSTDSEKYAEIARGYGAEVPFLRPQEFATDLSRDREFLLHALRWFKEQEQRVPNYLVLLRPTTPLRDPMLMERAIHKISTRPDCTSLCSGYELAESPAKNFALLVKENLFTGFMDETYLDAPRQECPKAYVWDGHIDILRSEYLMSNEDVFGLRRCALVTQPNVEIDTEEEFAYVEFLARSKSKEIYNFLTNYLGD